MYPKYPGWGSSFDYGFLFSKTRNRPITPQKNFKEPPHRGWDLGAFQHRHNLSPPLSLSPPTSDLLIKSPFHLIKKPT